jgi:hypothetical protein
MCELAGDPSTELANKLARMADRAGILDDLSE